MVEIKKELTIKEKVELICLVITAITSLVQAVASILK